MQIRFVSVYVLFMGILLLILGSAQVHADLMEGLIAWYPFDGGAEDASGNGHHGSVSGATLAPDRFGSSDSAYRFDGDDYISVPDDADFTLGAGPFTIAAWANFNAYGADGGYYLMGHSDGPGDTNKWIFWLGNNNISFIATKPGSDWIGLGNYDFELEPWYQVAIRRTGNTLEAFVNGSSIGTAAITSAIPDPSAPFRIGTAEFDRPNRPFRGLIDDVRLYDRALSDDEIRELVPEPATLSLLVLGSIILINRKRRK